MDSQSGGSVTHWIRELKTGEEGAAQQELWNRYFGRLVGLLGGRLRGTPQRDADKEDVALSVLKSFFLRANRGQFPNLRDRTGLWPLLVKIAGRKAINHRIHQLRQKRTFKLEKHLPSLEQIVGTEPTPDFAAQVADEVRQLLEALQDDTLRAVAQLKLEGYTNEEIAKKLDKSVRTVSRKLSLIRQEYTELEGRQE